MKEGPTGSRTLLRKRTGFVPISVFFILLTLHIILIFLILPEKQFFLKYPLLAYSHMQGKLPEERLVDLSPLYFYLHLVIVKIFANPLHPAQWLQIFCTALSGVLLFQLLRSFFPLIIAIAGLAAYAFNPSIIIYENALEPESLLILFLLGFVFCAIREGKVHKLLSGIFFALGVLTRANFLPLFILVPLCFFLKRKGSREWLRASVLFCLPVLTAITFLVMRNASLHGSFSPFVMNPGTVFFEGNNPNSTGKSGAYPPLLDGLVREYPNRPDYYHSLYRMVARRAEGRELSVVEVNDFWMTKARNFINDHPIRFLKLLLLKAHFIFHHYRRHDLANAFDYDREIGNRGIPSVPFWILSVLALAGLILNWKNWRRDLLFYLVFFCQIGVLFLTYVSARQRVAILPFFIFFACQAVWYARGSWKRGAVLLFFLIPGYLVFGRQTDLMREEDHLWQASKASFIYSSIARAERNRNNLEQARINAGLALASSPWEKEEARPAYLYFGKDGQACYARQRKEISPVGRSRDFSSRFDDALLALYAGNLDDAEAIFRALKGEGYQFKRDFHNSSHPDHFLGCVALERKNLEAAVQHFLTALRKSPGSPFSLSYLFAITKAEKYRTLLNRYFDRISADFFLGKAFLAIGAFSEARQYFSQVVKALPEYRKGLIYLAVCLGALEKYDAAAKIYIKAIQKREDPVFFEKEVLTIFRKWTERKPGDLERKHFYGLILHHFGHYKEALQMQKDAARLDPSNRAVSMELERLEKRLKHWPSGE